MLFCKCKLSAFILLLYTCISCQTPSPLILFSQNKMTIDYHIKIGHPLSSQQVADIQTLIDKTFAEIDQIFNKWNSYSEISQINQLQADIPFLLSPALADLFQQIHVYVQLSEGRFDPTIEPLQRLWITHLEQGSIPTQQQIDALKPCIGWNTLIIQERILVKKHAATQIDLGGIAKGLCVDWLVERLRALGYENIYVEWGGEIRVNGQHPSRRPWRVFISQLDNHAAHYALAHLTLKDQALATSGDYFQFWDVLDKNEIITYCHIIDPLTLYPLKVKKGSVASASLLANTCTTADALAKVCMLFETKEEFHKWIEKIQNQDSSIDYFIAYHS